MSMINGYLDPRTVEQIADNVKVFEVRVTWNDGTTEILPMVITAIEYYRSLGIQIITLIRLGDTPPPEVPLIDMIKFVLGTWNLQDDLINGEITLVPQSTYNFLSSANHILVRRFFDINGVMFGEQMQNVSFPKRLDGSFGSSQFRYTALSAFGNNDVLVQFRLFVSDIDKQFLVRPLDFHIEADKPPVVPDEETNGKTGLNFLQALPFMAIGALFLNDGLKNKRIGKKK